MYERYQTVRLHLMGNSIKQISTILNRTKKTIGTYIRPYKRHGLEGLTMKFSTGKATSNVSVANNMMQAYYLIKKCINYGTYVHDYSFEAEWQPEFLILASHVIGNCYLWELVSDYGFHTKITGYIQAADFIFYNCENDSLEKRLYPLIFLLRNAIEVCLKRLFYASVDNGVPRHVFFSKRRSHLRKKDFMEKCASNDTTLCFRK